MILPEDLLHKLSLHLQLDRVTLETMGITVGITTLIPHTSGSLSLPLAPAVQASNSSINGRDMRSTVTRNVTGALNYRFIATRVCLQNITSMKIIAMSIPFFELTVDQRGLTTKHWKQLKMAAQFLTCVA